LEWFPHSAYVGTNKERLWRDLLIASQRLLLLDACGEQNSKSKSKRENAPQAQNLFFASQVRAKLSCSGLISPLIFVKTHLFCL
jgi:hypothetical protein